MHVIELFAGAAGLAQGFERTGHYEAVALYDIFEPAQRSYLAYRSQAAYELCDVRELQEGQYSATVTDKLGPFRLQLPVTISIQELQEPSRLAAELRGNDGRGQARVHGRLETTLEPSAAGTRLQLHVHMEVLGRLASLGATPMRRRTDEIFAQFVERVRQELSPTS